jgi:hypothetical protein
MRHRRADPVAPQLALEFDDAAGIDVAQRDVAEAGQEVDVEHVGVALLRALGEGGLDVVGPPLLGRVV